LTILASKRGHPRGGPGGAGGGGCGKAGEGGDEGPCGNFALRRRRLQSVKDSQQPAWSRENNESRASNVHHGCPSPRTMAANEGNALLFSRPIITVLVLLLSTPKSKSKSKNETLRPSGVRPSLNQRNGLYSKRDAELPTRCLRTRRGTTRRSATSMARGARAAVSSNPGSGCMPTRSGATNASSSSKRSRAASAPYLLRCAPGSARARRRSRRAGHSRKGRRRW